VVYGYSFFSLDPAVHPCRIERRGAEGGHDARIAEHAEKAVPIVGSHLAKHQARGPEDQL
jgi:hypothetical protein